MENKILEAQVETSAVNRVEKDNSNELELMVTGDMIISEKILYKKREVKRTLDYALYDEGINKQYRLLSEAMNGKYAYQKLLSNGWISLTKKTTGGMSVLFVVNGVRTVFEVDSVAGVKECYSYKLLTGVENSRQEVTVNVTLEDVLKQIYASV